MYPFTKNYAPQAVQYWMLGVTMSLRQRLLLVAFSVLTISTSFSANADSSKEITRCAAESNSIKRLECFDALSNHLGVSSSKTSSTIISKWHVNKETSRIDDSTNVIVSLDSDTPISGWLGKTFTPSLVLRCKENKTELYIVTGMSPQVEYGTDGATITLRFDKEKATKYHTSKSTDGEALFFGQSIGVIKKMLGHTTLLFQFIPFNSSPAMTTFDLRGIQEAVKPLRETCKW
ncbi:type VI secretion system-associated protein TagO [Nitrosomonas sp.]|uniref:type VI secretion system-associated protein TagO n=1 Tax=Nitrosomonas sp. TaxID=42353 RepID=UPI0025D011A9|nr:type VI secretion system-associated protein TagO [Nitrosomonas sp.]